MATNTVTVSGGDKLYAKLEQLQRLKSASVIVGFFDSRREVIFSAMVAEYGRSRGRRGTIPPKRVLTKASEKVCAQLVAIACRHGIKDENSLRRMAKEAGVLGARVLKDGIRSENLIDEGDLLAACGFKKSWES